MTELIEAGIVLFVLVGSTVLGLFVQSLLGERHRGRETTELVRLVSAMMVTFTGLVLGLLLTTVKSSFDRIDSQLKVFSAQLIQLDQTLRLYGADADAARGQLRSYAAVAIASTWTGSRNPPAITIPRYHPSDRPASRTRPWVTCWRGSSGRSASWRRRT